MSASVRGKIDRRYDEMLAFDERREAKSQPLITEGIVEFCKNRLNFTPYSYQEKLMLDPAQFIVARWCRQSGKSHTIASMLLHQALFALIVVPLIGWKLYSLSRAPGPLVFPRFTQAIMWVQNQLNGNLDRTEYCPLSS